MTRPKLVVFDIAGTTIRSGFEVLHTFVNSFRKIGLKIPEEEIKKVRGYKKKQAIKMLLQKFYLGHTNIEIVAESIHQSFDEELANYFKSCNPLNLGLGAEDIFLWLKQEKIKVALNTGFTKVVTDIILTKMNWKNSDLIDEVISSDEVEEGRPSPMMIDEIMKRLSIWDPQDVMKVGDTEVDIAEGRNAKVGVVVSVTTGANTREELERFKPDFIIDNLSEIQFLITEKMIM